MRTRSIHLDLASIHRKRRMCNFNIHCVGDARKKILSRKNIFPRCAWRNHIKLQLDSIAVEHYCGGREKLSIFPSFKKRSQQLPRFTKFSVVNQSDKHNHRRTWEEEPQQTVFLEHQNEYKLETNSSNGSLDITNWAGWSHFAKNLVINLRQRVDLYLENSHKASGSFNLGFYDEQKQYLLDFLLPFTEKIFVEQTRNYHNILVIVVLWSCLESNCTIPPTTGRAGAGWSWGEL